jgi:hypothetical protein
MATRIDYEMAYKVERAINAAWRCATCEIQFGAPNDDSAICPKCGRFISWATLYRGDWGRW